MVVYYFFICVSQSKSYAQLMEAHAARQMNANITIWCARRRCARAQVQATFGTEPIAVRRRTTRRTFI